jgi:hypothetical protein
MKVRIYTLHDPNIIFIFCVADVAVGDLDGCAIRDKIEGDIELIARGTSCYTVDDEWRYESRGDCM